MTTFALKLARLGLLAALLAGGLGQAAAEERFITVASTTSTEQSGLFAYLLPIFRMATGIEVRVVAVGTGQALAIGARGDADALLVHDRAGEDKLVAAGDGRDRRDVMANDYVLVGPGTDPAGIAGDHDVLAGLRRIAAAAAPFTSRGDDSGTQRLELRLWQAAGTDPTGQPWYRELGAGMGATLNTAAALDAYTIADRASWANFKNRQNLTVLLEGDPRLFNPYSSILINPAKHPSVKADLARTWHAWLTSSPGKLAIAAFRVDGQQVFFPAP